MSVFQPITKKMDSKYYYKGGSGPEFIEDIVEILKRMTK